MALNYSFVNRLTIIRFIRDSLLENFKNLKLSILVDLNHDSLYLEKIDGKSYYVHRYGANRAYPKELLKKHKIFKHTGQLLLVPGSMAHYSYLAVADKGTKETLYSANHGAGRVLDKVESRNKFNMEKLKEEMETFKVRLYRYGVGNIIEEIPSSFKNINEIIKVMSSNKIAKPIVRLKPIGVLKGN